MTGGAGTLGRAIIRRSIEDGEKNLFTVYSRDPLKQHKLKKEFPDVTAVVGDILDFESLKMAMAGHDVVIHAAAMKHIPEAELYPTTCFDINVIGSLNVVRAAIEVGVKKVVGVSTDKVCHPVNAYGATKFMMERLFQEHALSEYGEGTDFLLVRYGNVLASNGSVVQVWEQMLKDDGKITATDPDMTRFWLTQDDAAEIIKDALAHGNSGEIVIPNLSSLSMSRMKEYLYPDAEIEYVGMRPGEKRHECLITEEECHFVYIPAYPNYYILVPNVIGPFAVQSAKPFTSDDAKEITQERLLQMLGRI